MKRYILVVLVLIMFLAGCSENQEIFLSESEKELDNAKLKIAELEKQVSNLQEELSKEKEEKLEKEKVKKDNFTGHEVLRIVAVDGEELKYVLDRTNKATQSVAIVGSNINNLVEDYKEIRIKGLGSGEYLRAEVIGSIYDFQLIKLEWNDETNKFTEGKVLEELEEVRNKTIYIETYLPCGMPTEKIKWKDATGKTHEFILSNDGYGFDGFIIWS